MMSEQTNGNGEWVQACQPLPGRGLHGLMEFLSTDNLIIKHIGSGFHSPEIRYRVLRVPDSRTRMEL